MECIIYSWTILYIKFYCSFSSKTNPNNKKIINTLTQSKTLLGTASFFNFNISSI